MHKLKLLWNKPEPKILCLGAHPDDIEIGCGGTILRLIKEAPRAQIYWTIFSGNQQRSKEAQTSADHFLKEAHLKTIDIKDFRESYFPFIGNQIKDYFEKLKTTLTPDIIFTHYANDLHQDHSTISKLTWNSFRNHLILEYEIPKFDGDLGNPNFFVHLNDYQVKKKINFLCTTFKTQKEKTWFDEETFRSILRIRGIESNSQSKYAEAFYCRKMFF